MQGRKTFIRHLDQGAVNLFRKIISGQGPIQNVVIFPHARLKDIGLDLRKKHLTHGALVIPKLPPEGVKDCLAVITIVDRTVFRVTGLIQVDFLAIGQSNAGPRKISIRKDTVDL